MDKQLLLIGEDAFFDSRELSLNHNTLQVTTSAEALSLLERFDFHAIIARDGADILKAVRDQGKHTPFLNLSHAESVSDCCGGHLSPEAPETEKAEVLGKLMIRNHDTDCC